MKLLNHFSYDKKKRHFNYLREKMFAQCGTMKKKNCVFPL